MEKFHTPSGRTLFADDLDLLHRLEHIGTIAWGDEVTFNSGFRSRVYIRARNELSHDPELLLEVAARIKSQVEELPITHGPQLCLIGIPTAGTQLAQAVSHLSMSEHLDLGAGSELEHPICFSTMRSALKGHGKDQTWVGVPDLNKHTYVTVENVVSTASSMLNVFKKLETEGYPVKEMHHIVFADWELGGMEALAAAGYHNVHVLYIVRDIVAAFVHTGRWPHKHLADVERRFAAFRQK